MKVDDAKEAKVGDFVYYQGRRVQIDHIFEYGLNGGKIISRVLEIRFPQGGLQRVSFDELSTSPPAQRPPARVTPQIKG